MTPAVQITTRKLASLAPPVWRAYAGLSVLYDDPGEPVRGGLQPLVSSSTAPPGDHDVYDRLADLAARIHDAAGGDDAGVGLLPRHAYHVTVCDGVHVGQRAHAHAHVRAELDAVLDGLPDSLLWHGALVRLLRAPELCDSVWAHPVRLGVDGLAVWGHAVVARLVPADERAAAALACHARDRGELAARLRDRVGVEPPEWHPHVTLAYAANHDAAARLRDEVLPAWDAHARERTAGRSVTFRSASLYGFTDMASFWRLVH